MQNFNRATEERLRKEILGLGKRGGVPKQEEGARRSNLTTTEHSLGLFKSPLI